MDNHTATMEVLGRMARQYAKETEHGKGNGRQFRVEQGHNIQPVAARVER